MKKNLLIVFFLILTIEISFGSTEHGRPSMTERAEQGEALAQFLLGRDYHNGWGVEKNYTEAFKWYFKAAAQQHLLALTSLGTMLYHGQGVEQDYTESFKWFHMAAILYPEDVDGKKDLGYMYLMGYGVEENYTEAFRWISKAAEKGVGFIHAQLLLGTMYNIGQGVNADYIEAYKWFIIALAGAKEPDPPDVRFLLPKWNTETFKKIDEIREYERNEKKKLQSSLENIMNTSTQKGAMNKERISEAKRRAGEWFKIHKP